jgi:DNA-binding NtrC family response regulator
MASILVVDDEMGIRELLNEILTDEGHSVISAQNAQEARNARDNLEPDLVLLDIWMPDVVTLLKEWSVGGQLTMPVVMMSGHATIDTAVEATRIGAVNFLEKPIALQKLLKTVEQALEKAPPKELFQPEIKQEVAISAPKVEELEVHESRDVKDMPGNFDLAYIDLPLREARDLFEKAYFEYHLEQLGGNMTKVADKTGLERTHLYRKLKMLGIDVGSYKGD